MLMTLKQNESQGFARKAYTSPECEAAVLCPYEVVCGSFESEELENFGLDIEFGDWLL